MSGANMNAIEKRLERIEKNMKKIAYYLEDRSMTAAQYKKYLKTLEAIRSGKAKKWVRARDVYKEFNK
jgi:hypothetical protein